MHKKKYLLILSSLEKEELKSLSRFLLSPVHNANKNIVKLFNYVKSLPVEQAEEKTELKILYKKIFPSKAYNEKIIRNLVYEFTNRLEDFLAVKNFLSDPLSFEKHLLEEAEMKKLDKITKEHLKTADEILSGVTTRDERYYSSKAFIEQKRYNIEYPEVPMGKSIALSNIKEEYIKNTSSFFILVMLSEYFQKINRENQINSSIELKLAEQIMSFLDTEIGNYKDEPSIYLLYRFLKLSMETSAGELEELKNITLENREKIPQSYFKDFILELYNFCKQKQQGGFSEFGSKAFELLSFMEENGLLLERDGTMLEHNYTNSAASAVRIGKLDWATGFIQKYKSYLPENLRENAYCYNMAVVNFISGINSNEKKTPLLENAMEYLSSVKTEDFYHTTRINNLLLLIYFELNIFETAYSLIDTYRHFLHNNSLIPASLQKRYLNFLNYINRLINIKSGSRKTSLERLKLDVLNNETEYKKWLISKIEELE